MPISADILDRRMRGFTAWVPKTQAAVPHLVIGTLQVGNPPAVVNIRSVPMTPVAGVTGLWELPIASAGVLEDTVYHYWLEVDDSRSGTNPPARIAVTDPFAFSVDWRVFPPGSQDCTQPAAVAKLAGNVLVDCDPGGEVAAFAVSEPAMDTLPANNFLVIYELPTAWTITRSVNAPERDDATFLDVAALADDALGGANFSELGILTKGRAYLNELGVNALELLPPADSFFKREWGYDTSHYLAPDYELGYPEGNLSPTANRDLATLVDRCHRSGIRFFIDAVMAFGKEDPFNRIDASDFHIDDPKSEPGDPDAMTSTRGNGSRGFRDGFGSTLWRYAKFITTYDPISGQDAPISPARQYMLTYLIRWMRDFHVDGVRLDSIENIASWDFIGDYRNLAHQIWTTRWQDAGLAGVPDSRFIVVGEELSLPLDLLRQGRLDGLWNEAFQGRVRAAILGENTGSDNFEWTVRRMIDCRQAGFTDGTQSVNYITKHDVEGFRHERLFTSLNGQPVDLIEKRIKLAFACLLTAVGIPMILAGEEFADQHDLFDRNGQVSQNGGKQIDPVNFSRLTNAGTGSDEDSQNAPMRRRIFAVVSRLIRLRTTAPALGVNDTDFIHVDFNDGKRVLAWKRGGAANDPVIVLANFSDFASAPGTDYQVNNWPPTPAGKKWIEVTQARDVDPAFVGREAIFAWEAKVYTLADL